MKTSSGHPTSSSPLRASRHLAGDPRRTRRNSAAVPHTMLRFSARSTPSHPQARTSILARDIVKPATARSAGAAIRHARTLICRGECALGRRHPTGYLQECPARRPPANHPVTRLAITMRILSHSIPRVIMTTTSPSVTTNNRTPTVSVAVAPPAPSKLKRAVTVRIHPNSRVQPVLLSEVCNSSVLPVPEAPKGTVNHTTSLSNLVQR
jgi:hypothetical protein